MGGYLFGLHMVYMPRLSTMQRSTRCMQPALANISFQMQEVRPLGERLLEGVSPADAVHVLAQFEVAPLCIGHNLCWEGDTVESVWLLQVWATLLSQGVKLQTGADLKPRPLKVNWSELSACQSSLRPSLQEGNLVILDGVLPSGRVISGPSLIVPFDLSTWLEHQREQQLAGAPPHAHTHPLHAHRWGRVLGLRLPQGAAQRDIAGGGSSGGSDAAHVDQDRAHAPPPCYTQSLQVR